MITGGFNSRYDYRPGPQYKTIPAGETNASITIIIYDDNTIESNEMFSLKISSLPDYVHYGSINSATVTIVDEQSE